MLDVSWLSQEARNIHAIFESLFYGLAVIFILMAVVTEYFNMPLGGVQWSPQLIARVLIAAFLLHSYPEVTNALSEFTDALTTKIGGFNEFHHVLDKMGDKLKTLSMSWISIKEALILGFSFITFFLLYISVFIANAGVVFVWLVLYVFSPVLIVFFIMPSTAFITKTLYRSLIEVCAWKIVWATLAALLWSSALNDINKQDVNFLTVISFNLILAASLLFTPLIVNALASSGLSSFAGSAMGMAAGAAAFMPGAIAKKAVVGTISKVGSGLGAVAGGLAQSIKSPSKDIARNDRPPKWQKDIPMPKAPPGWLQEKLDQERKSKRKD